MHGVMRDRSPSRQVVHRGVARDQVVQSRAPSPTTGQSHARERGRQQQRTVRGRRIPPVGLGASLRQPQHRPSSSSSPPLTRVQRPPCECLSCLRVTLNSAEDDQPRTLPGIAGLLERVVSEIRADHVATNLSSGLPADSLIAGERSIHDSTAVPVLLSGMLERCSAELTAAHSEQSVLELQLSQRVVELEGQLANEQTTRLAVEANQREVVERSESRVAEAELGYLEGRMNMEMRGDAAEAARVHAQRLSASCERKIAAAVKKTEEVEEKLRLAELELAKRTGGKDAASLRAQLERVRTESLGLRQQFEGSAKRCEALEVEKVDLARRLALASLAQTAKSRWTEGATVAMTSAAALVTLPVWNADVAALSPAQQQGSTALKATSKKSTPLAATQTNRQSAGQLNTPKVTPPPQEPEPAMRAALAEFITPRPDVMVAIIAARSPAVAQAMGEGWGPGGAANETLETATQRLERQKARGGRPPPPPSPAPEPEPEPQAQATQ